MCFEKENFVLLISFIFVISIFVSIVLDRLETQLRRDTTKFLPDTLDTNSLCKEVVCGGGGLSVP